MYWTAYGLNLFFNESLVLEHTPEDLQMNKRKGKTFKYFLYHQEECDQNSGNVCSKTSNG